MADFSKYHIMGLDLGKTTGICEGAPGSIPVMSTQVFGVSDTEHDDVFRNVAKWVFTRFKTNIPNEVWIEELQRFNQPGRHADILGIGIYATVFGLLKYRGVRVRKVGVGTSRKLFIGRGDYRRDEAKHRVMKQCAKLGWEPTNDNEGDAGCVWYWACHKVAPELMQGTTPLGF